MISKNLKNGGANSIHLKTPVSKYRIYLLRGLYFLVLITLGPDALSEIFNAQNPINPIQGIAYSFWAAFALLCGLGVRYPLKMLPLLLLQLFYKSIWLLGVYMPSREGGNLDETAHGLFMACFIGVVLDLLIIPWKYVYREFLRKLFRFN